MRKIRTILSAMFCLLLAVVLIGCSANSSYEGGKTEAADPGGRAPIYEDSESMTAPAPKPEEQQHDAGGTAGEKSPIAGTGSAAGGNVSADKLIKNVYLRGETRSFDDAVAGVKAAVERMGGYIESASEYGKKPEAYGDSGRTANIVARIPADRLDAFLSDAGNLIDIISQSSNVTNVTTQYYDYEARKKTYEIQLERLESILTEASELSDILALETEIARVRYELESIETALRNLDNQISYSTVTLDFYELTQFERPQATEQSLGERISAAFAQSLKNTGIFLQDLLVWFSGNFFGLLLLAALAVLIWRLAAWLRKRRGHAPGRRLRSPKGNAPQPAEVQTQAERAPEDDTIKPE